MTKKIEIWSRNRLYVEASVDAGELTIYGDDLSGSAMYGGEYEYWITVAPDEVPKVVAALGGTAGDDVLELLAAKAEEIVTRGERSWLSDRGIETKLTTWTSD